MISACGATPAYSPFEAAPFPAATPAQAVPWPSTSQTAMRYGARRNSWVSMSRLKIVPIGAPLGYLISAGSPIPVAWSSLVVSQKYSTRETGLPLASRVMKSG
jgi:hypothetical protein